MGTSIDIPSVSVEGDHYSCLYNFRFIGNPFSACLFSILRLFFVIHQDSLLEGRATWVRTPKVPK